jgi:hypothetical protein
MHFAGTMSERPPFFGVGQTTSLATPTPGHTALTWPGCSNGRERLLCSGMTRPTTLANRQPPGSSASELAIRHNTRGIADAFLMRQDRLLMSNQTENQPFAEPHPWQGQQSWTPQQPPLPPPPFIQQPPAQPWQPAPAAPKQGKGLAITALVVACIALVLVLGVMVSGFLTGFMPLMSGDLQGTAPQVVLGEPYPGTLLADEVSRVISWDGGDVGSITCPDTPEVRAGVTADCHGKIDGFESAVTVTFVDGVGHFTLVEQDAAGG